MPMDEIVERSVVVVLGTPDFLILSFQSNQYGLLETVCFCSFFDLKSP